VRSDLRLDTRAHDDAGFLDAGRCQGRHQFTA